MVLKFGNAANSCIMGNINTLLTREAQDNLQKIYTLNCLHGKRGGVSGRTLSQVRENEAWRKVHNLHGCTRLLLYLDAMQRAGHMNKKQKDC